MSLAKVFWDQQWKQIWFPEEIAVSKDFKQWQNFEHQDTYKKVFGGLTLLDTVQTNIGMNEIANTPLICKKRLCLQCLLLLRQFMRNRTRIFLRHFAQIPKLMKCSNG